MAEAIKFTEARVSALRQSVKSGRVEFKDAEIPGLLLRVTPSSASWSLVKRLPGGGVTRVSLGKADVVSVADARKLARIRIGEMHQGVDPNAVKRERKAAAQRDSLTLAEGLEIYLTERELRPETKRTYERDLRITFGDYLDQPLTQLTPDVVRNRHKDRKTRDIRAQAKVETALARKRVKASPARADGAVRALRAIVNYLRSERGLDLPEVSRRISATKGWGNVARRKRGFVGQDLTEFVEALRRLGDDLPPDLTGTQRDLSLLLLCTSLRWSSGAGLLWSEVDFKKKTITVPKDRMKGKVAHTLPLGPEMMAMLRKRHSAATSKDLVFPGLPRKVKGKMVEKPLASISQRFYPKVVGADGAPLKWSPHDLRRSCLTVLTKLGYSENILKDVAAHAQDEDVTDAYVLDDLDHLRSVIEKIERRIFRGPKSAKVIPLRRAGA